MRALPTARAILLALGYLTTSALPVRGQGSPPPPPAPAAASRVSTQVELQIELVAPLSRYSGSAYVTAVDPRFVLVGKVVWVQRSDVLPLNSRQAFAIHSPTRLGLAGWQRGSTICLLLTRTIKDEVRHWELSPMKPDAGCRGGG